MPLIHSTSPEAISKNISTEKHAHPDMPTKQAVAIAYHAGGEKDSSMPYVGEAKPALDFGYKDGDPVGAPCSKDTAMENLPSHVTLAESEQRNDTFWRGNQG